MSPVQWVRVDDTTWPVDVETESVDSVEWTVRYAPDRLTRGDQLGVASILSAYRALTSPARGISEATQMLRRARRARGEV